MSAPGRGRMPAGDRWLVAALAALLAAVWLEAPRSHLAEPDEARYAEIPREMLAARDFVTPRLNGVPYFEKPPLLYWANAASFALLGTTPFAARLPTRLAGTATALLLAFAVSRLRGRREGLLAAIFLAAAPFGFAAARMNLTDGILTFFFTATLLAALATLSRAAAGRPTAALAALTGALAAGGFLSKGLIALALPGGILLFWALAARARGLASLVVSPAAPVFLILTVPWLVLAEKANPGFLQFFFVHEHFQRFATPAASRPGPIYYFAGLFLAAFLPGLPFFFRGARETFRRDPLSLFFGIWFAVVLVFFSVSRSKLPPYVFPALPAAAALAARGFTVFRATRAPWRWHAAIVAAFLAACAAIPDVRRAVSESGIVPLALVGALSLAAGAAAALGVRRAETAAAAMGFGWAGLYLVLALAWPKLPLATDVADLAGAAGSASKERGAARIVGYRCYLQGFPWNLRATIPVADFKGELEDWWLPEGERREVFWSRGRFREEWSGRPLVALVRERDRKDFEGIEPPARFLRCRGKYCVAANW